MRFIRVLFLLCLLALAATPAAFALRFTDDDFDMPVGQLGEAYSKQFHGGAGCGPALPYQFRILSGTLPPGITLDSSGLFSGSPTHVGSWSFWVELSDQDPPTASWCVPKKSQRQFTITVAPATLTAEVARPFRETLPGTGWSLATDSNLPSGLAFDPATGVISGEPTATGSWPIDLVLTNTLGWKDTVTVDLKIAPTLTIATHTLHFAKAGHVYTARLKGEDGVAPYAWKILRGTLPQGIRLGAKTGVLAGTAHRTGTFPITVRVSDRFGAISTRSFAIRIFR